MQAVLTKEIKFDMNQALERMFSDLDDADNMTRNAIENDVVRFGDKAAKFLINKVKTARGAQRGIAAMSLIRIGESSIKLLKEEARENKEFQWVANYLIKEISGK